MWIGLTPLCPFSGRSPVRPFRHALQCDICRPNVTWGLRQPRLLLPCLTDRLGSTQRIAVVRMRRVLAEGVGDGSVRRTDLDVLATSLVIAVAPFVISARLLDEVGRDAALDELTRMVDAWLA